MHRPWLIWLPFVACLAVVLSAMGWVSLEAWRLDRAEVEARRLAALEENVQLALWRMDSLLAPVVAQESARPAAAYTGSLPPAAESGWPYRVGHFDVAPEGGLVWSPEVSPTAAVRHRLATRTDWGALVARLPAPTAIGPLATAPLAGAMGPSAASPRSPEAQARTRGAIEFGNRSQFVQNANTLGSARAVNPPDVAAIRFDAAGGGLVTPLWLEGELVLARRVVLGGGEHVQGCLVDWPALERQLLATVADLLPQADLLPVDAASDQDQSRLLAALPVRLVPGALPDGGPSPAWPMQLSLAIAWAGVLLAAAAVAGLLAGVIRLSRRRAAFVSAVTHELRTPLTTFQMYTEMLAEGMVADPLKQREYLHTLQSEAARLTHLVENVLAYARLERGRSDGRVVDLGLGELVEPLVPRLAARAAEAGMELVFEPNEAAATARVRANPSAVEQILLNLVDNAAKYASGASDRRIHLEMIALSAGAELAVRDHGPGIGRAERRRLFRPLRKSAREAAHSAPGVGLGLALSRRLARDMGARLELDRHVGQGARFVLTLAPPAAIAP